MLWGETKGLDRMREMARFLHSQQEVFSTNPDLSREEVSAMESAKGIWLALLSLSLMLEGCVLLVAGAAGGAGAGTVAYVKGELKATYAAPLERTWKASLEALESLDIQVSRAEKDDAGGTIEARRVDGTKVTLSVAPAGPDTTTVKIRIGLFGDQEASQTIHRRIAANLGTK